MGISIGAIAFKSDSNLHDLEGLLSEVFDKKAEQVVLSDGEYFDSRKSDNVTVLLHESTILICNSDLALSVLRGAKNERPSQLKSEKIPPSIFVFCCFGSGGSYGFGLTENFKLVRARVQLAGDFPPEIDFGIPSDIESNWLEGSFYYDEEDEDQDDKIFVNRESKKESSEYWLTQNMLIDLFKSQFKFDVINDEISYERMYFTLE